MVKIKVSESTNPQLDWLVARCEGAIGIRFDGEFWRVHFGGSEEYLGNLDYTASWPLMGPIIDREAIAISPLPDGLWRAYSHDGTQWVPRGELGLVELFKWKHKQEGYHPLIAAARCYVVSKLGEEVEIPEELYG